MGAANVTWIGHATARIEMGGDAVLIDPLGRARCRDLGYRAVLITHAHVDHLNRWTLRALDKGVTLYVPRGARGIVADLGFRAVREVEPGDQIQEGGLEISAVPTRHDPGRWRKGDGPICAGYVLQHDGYTVHHSGDIDISDFHVFDELGDRFAIDAALLPIGGMLPVWYYRWRRSAKDRGVHIDPDTALEVANRLGAKQMVPVHYGTVQLPFGPARTAPWRLARVAEQQRSEHKVRILGHGETLALDEPAPDGGAATADEPGAADQPGGADQPR